MSGLPKPRYTIWQAITAALAVAERALNEVRALAREPGPRGEKGERGEMGIGFPEMKPFYDGKRTFGFQWFSNGKIVKEELWKLPSQIYQGVFKDGIAYERGDLVTWNGSQWHCNIDDPKVKPGGDDKKAWTLAVKRGQDGRDGTNGRMVVPPTNNIPFGDK